MNTLSTRLEALLEYLLARNMLVRVVSGLHLVSILMLVWFYGRWWEAPGLDVFKLVVFLFGILIAILTIWVLVELGRGFTRRASSMVVTSGVLAVTLAQLATGFQRPWFVFYFWMLALGGLLLGRRSALMTGAGSAGLMILLWGLAQFGVIPGPDPTTLVGGSSLMMIVATIGLTTFVSWRMNGELIANQQRAGAQVGHLSEDLISLSGNQAKRSTDQATIVIETVDALQALNNSADQVARLANRVNMAALLDVQQTEQAQHAASLTIAELDEVRTSSSLLLKRMQALSEMATQIGGVISLIQGLARETQLLALNASIEAAGSGEYGIRFGVVADEVKRLALRSIQATSDVETVLHDIQTATAGVSGALTDNANAIEITGQRATRMNKVIDDLVNSVAQSAEIAEQIAAATTQQLASGDHVVDLMQTVRQESTELSTQAQRLSRVAHQLEHIARRLTQS